MADITGCRVYMRKPTLFTNMKIRSSLILVLVFFLIMLVAGAALGVLSIQANNRALNNIMLNQRLGASLYSVIDNYKNERAEEHTSEHQSLTRNYTDVICSQKKYQIIKHYNTRTQNP